jgi:hypothetical protein
MVEDRFLFSDGLNPLKKCFRKGMSIFCDMTESSLINFRLSIFVSCKLLKKVCFDYSPLPKKIFFSLISQ